MKAIIVGVFLILPLICPAQEKAGSATNKVYNVVEIMPQYPGGLGQMFTFISKNLKYPNGRICAVGKVFVQFLVEKDGSVTSIKIVRGIHPLLDAEVERVVKLFPKWTPGKQDGENVAVRMVIPIDFHLGK